MLLDLQDWRIKRASIAAGVSFAVQIIFAKLGVRSNGPLLGLRLDTPATWAQIGQNLGVYVIASAFMFALVYFFSRAPRQYVACSKCATVFPDAVVGLSCPKCNHQLEPLKGFYIRHSEHSKTPRAGS